MYRNKKFLLRGINFLSLALCTSLLSLAPLEITKAADVCPSVEFKGSISGHPSGCFDFYVFTQSWYPEVCFSGSFRYPGTLHCPRIGTNVELTSNLVPIDLHPYIASGSNKFASPIKCSGATSFGLSDLKSTTISSIYHQFPQMSGKNMLHYLWDHSGSCSSLSPENYFLSISRANNKVKPLNLAKYSGSTISYRELLDYYKSMGVEEGQFLPVCRSYNSRNFAQGNGSKQYLYEVLTQFNKNFKSVDVSTSIKNSLSRSSFKNRFICDASQPIHVRKSAEFLRVAEVQARLDKTYSQGISVGFDIDGTVFDGNALSQYIAQRCGSIEKSLVNTGNGHTCLAVAIKDFDSYKYDSMVSSLKAGTYEMIKFHMQRNDKVFIITKRPGSDKAALPGYLTEIFSDFGKFVNVVYTGRKSKTPFIKERKLDIYYGDIDSDIFETLEAGAMPIRVINNNKRRPGVHLGVTGELILDSRDIMLYEPDNKRNM